jgi:hypothetical protein
VIEHFNHGSDVDCLACLAEEAAEASTEPEPERIETFDDDGYWADFEKSVAQGGKP